MASVPLWAVATPESTVYAIERRRGYTEASRILGEDFSGVIGADGCAAYRRFGSPEHQTCLGHLLRRCRGMIEVSWGRGDRHHVEATNWPAEQAIRPAVVSRKVWGGNRTALAPTLRPFS